MPDTTNEFLVAAILGERERIARLCDDLALQARKELAWDSYEDANLNGRARAFEDLAETLRKRE